MEKTREQQLFAADPDQALASRLTLRIRNAGGGGHVAIEDERAGLRYVHCSCGRRGCPGVTWEDAYGPHIVHLNTLARGIGVLTS